MRSAHITVTCYGSDVKSALERLFADVLGAVEPGDLPPFTIQVRVSDMHDEHAVEPPPLDRLPSAFNPTGQDTRFVAEGRLWCQRLPAQAPIMPPKLCVPALPPKAGQDGG